MIRKMKYMTGSKTCTININFTYFLLLKKIWLLENIKYVASFIFLLDSTLLKGF